MAKKEFTLYGKSLDEIKALDTSQLAALLPARARRSLLRGTNDQKRAVLKKIRRDHKNLRTHARDMIVVPEMVGRLVKVYNGREWVLVSIEPEMIGHYLGEFTLTRKSVTHSAPGIGATKSSASMSVR